MADIADKSRRSYTVEQETWDHIEIGCLQRIAKVAGSNPAGCIENPPENHTSAFLPLGRNRPKTTRQKPNSRVDLGLISRRSGGAA